MPVYEYHASEGHAGCEKCSGGFSIVQKITEARLETCPQCGAPIERLVFAVGIATPKGNSELKNLGFTKLVRRDTGVYENVTAGKSESRYMVAGKPDTMPKFTDKITD